MRQGCPGAWGRARSPRVPGPAPSWVIYTGALAPRGWLRAGGRMETRLGHGLMGGWGRGPPLPPPGRCRRSRGAAPPAVPAGAAAGTDLAVPSPLPSPLCHPGVPKAIAASQTPPPARPGLRWLSPKAATAAPSPRPGGFVPVVPWLEAAPGPGPRRGHGGRGRAGCHPPGTGPRGGTGAADAGKGPRACRGWLGWSHPRVAPRECPRPSERGDGTHVSVPPVSFPPVSLCPPWVR